MLVLAGVLAVAGGGAGAAVASGALRGGSPAADAAAAPAHPAWLLTVDPESLPEPPLPADAPVLEPGEDGLLTLEQLQALGGASVERDADGRLRATTGDWRAGATLLDAVRGLPGLVDVAEAPGAGPEVVRVTTDLAPEQLLGLPGVVGVATEDGTPWTPPPAAEAPAEPAAGAPADSGH